MTCALASVLVTLALLAEAGVLTVRTPAVVVAGTLSSQVVTLAIGITVTLPFTVRTPELGRALGITARSKIPMSTAAFVRPYTYLIFFTGEVSLTERRGAFIP